MGNRTSSGHQSGMWIYNVDNQFTQYPRTTPFSGALAQNTQVTYTPQGHTQNEKSGAWQRDYRYNAAERLIETSQNGQSTSYRYDPFGRRISKSIGSARAGAGAGPSTTTYYLYSDTGLMAETDGQGQLIKAYGFNPKAAQQGLWSTDPIWQADVTANSLTSTSTSYHYLHTDHLATPTLATDKTGSTTWKGASEAFGATTTTIQAIDMNLRFPGQYWDQETQTHYNFNRDYYPISGKYIQADPVGMKGGLNLYLYVHNNPLRFYDYHGLSPAPCCNPEYSDADCCGKIPTNDEGLFMIAGGSAGGTVMCCQGRKISCVARAYNKSSSSSSIIRRCIDKHEKKHFGHVGSCASNCDAVLMNHEGDPDRNECEAYAVELDCLRDNIGECGSDIACRIRINGEINSTRDTGRKKYGCSF